MKTEHISIRISPKLVQKLNDLSNEKRWSRNQTICIMIEETLKRYELTGDFS